MPIAHTGFIVGDLEAAKTFYLAILAPLGYELVETYPTALGLGVGGVPDFWIHTGEGCPGSLPVKPAPHTGVHVAFAVQSREVVDQFYAAAMKAGATDNGAPGLRDYIPGYYATYIRDSQGNNIEACHIQG